MNKKYNKMASDLAKAGRYGDDQIIHVSKAEVEGLGSLLPSGKLPNNPKTGQPEAFVITVPMLLTALATGAATGGIAGGVTAKQRNIPLWEGILAGAGKGAVTSLVTAGIGGALTPAAAPLAEGASTAATAADLAATATDALGTQVATLPDLAVNTSLDALNPLLPVENALSFVPEVPVAGTEAVSFVDPSAGISQPLVTPGTGPLPPTEGSSLVDQIMEPLVPPSPAGNEALARLGDSADLIEAGGEVVVAEGPGMVEGLLGENNTEYLNWLLDNPQLAMAPGMVELATGRSEWDEENYPGYDGPGPSWTTGPGTAEGPSWSSGASTGSASRPSWAARDGGEVKRRKPEAKYDSKSLSKIKGLLSMVDRTMNPSIPGKYNPLSDSDIQMKLRPSMPGGMHRVGVTLPFRDGGVASSNRFQRGLGSLRRP